MTVKHLAEELSLPPLLLREMLKAGLLAGEKQRAGWVVHEASVDALRRAVLTLRSALPGAHDEECWTWLYEPDVEMTPARPWQAPMPVNAGGWLGEQVPAPTTPAAPATQPVPEERSGPPCAHCHEPMVLRMVDADLGDAWYCPECQVARSQEPDLESPQEPPLHAWHSADLEIMEIVKKSS
jgi:hypothetical protein